MAVEEVEQGTLVDDELRATGRLGKVLDRQEIGVRSRRASKG